MSLALSTVLSGLLIMTALALLLILRSQSSQLGTQQQSDIDAERTSTEETTAQRMEDSTTTTHGRETMIESESMTATELKVKSKLYHYIAHVTDVYDGDTITVDIDMGMGLWQHDVRIRLWRVDTSELRGDDREQGLAARDFVRSLVMDRDILLRTILDKRGQDRTGKYGRLLGEVLVEDNSGRMLNLNQLLLDKGFATPVAPDGRSSTVAPAAAPQPESETSATPRQAEFVVCMYCGEMRSINNSSGQVAACTNCFDEAHTLDPINS